ncbi:MAG TPA: hypothetical protein VFU64_07295 [Gaiellaceae bacterium]|nr:hypothetical protein [Gaiellaceae bacterium]
MSRLRESTTYWERPAPDEAVLAGPGEHPSGHAPAILRTLGAIAVLVVGAVHLEQYIAEHFNVVPIIGPLFALNFAGATLIGLGLLVPAARLRVVHLLLALGGIGLAATSFVFLFISEHQPLFGFQDYGYRTEIVVALAAEAAAVVTLAAYLATRVRRQV